MLHIEERGLDKLLISCVEVGGAEIASVELHTSERLDALRRAMAQSQPSHCGHWCFVRLDGRVLEDPDGESTLAELLGLAPRVEVVESASCQRRLRRRVKGPP